MSTNNGLNAQLDSIFANLLPAIGKREAVTGLPGLDEILGLTPGAQLIVVTAKPRMGRSALALQLTLNAAHAQRTLFLSADHPAEQMLFRMVANQCRASLPRLLRWHVEERDLERLAHAAGRISDLALEILDAYDLSPEDINTLAQERHSESPLGLIVIDGLEFTNLGGQSIADALMSLRRLSRRLNCRIIVTTPSDARVEQRPNHRLMESDLNPAEFNAADTVLALYRDELYNPESDSAGILEIEVLRQKFGPSARQKLLFAAGSSAIVSIESGA